METYVSETLKLLLPTAAYFQISTTDLELKINKSGRVLALHDDRPVCKAKLAEIVIFCHFCLTCGRPTVCAAIGSQ